MPAADKAKLNQQSVAAYKLPEPAASKSVRYVWPWDQQKKGKLRGRVPRNTSTCGCCPWLCPRQKKGNGLTSDRGGNAEKTDKSVRIVTEYGGLAAIQRVGASVHIVGRYHTLASGRRVVDDYIIDEENVLGDGINGKVCWAQNRLTGDSCAIKTLPTQNIGLDIQQELVNEVVLSLSLDHPHIARLHDVYETEEQIILVMELLHGGEVTDRVYDQKRFSERQAQQATWQMLLSLRYLHCRKVVHRDIKLGNFMYTEEGGDTIKMIDLGFCRVLEKDSRCNRCLGTVQYMAPEVVDTSVNYDFAVDLWSLGVVVFVLLTGSLPFDRRDAKGMHSQSATLQAIQQCRYKMKREIWDSIPEAANFVKKLLDLNTKTRYTAEQALADPWMRNCDLQSATPGGQGGFNREIVKAMTDWSKRSHFHHQCMRLISWSLSHDGRKRVRNAFLLLDGSVGNNTGFVTFQEFWEMIGKMGVSQEDARAIFDSMDSSPLGHATRGEFTYADFIAATMASQCDIDDALLNDAFRRFEVDKNDDPKNPRIKPSEVQRILNVSANCFKEEFDKMDEDGTESVNKQEFKNYVQNYVREARK